MFIPLSCAERARRAGERTEERNLTKEESPDSIVRWCPCFEHREPWASASRDGAKVGQPPFVHGKHRATIRVFFAIKSCATLVTLGGIAVTQIHK